MLHEIDTALRSLLAAELPAGTAVRFDPPEVSWRGPQPVVGLFLHQVQEDVDSRVAAWSEERDADGALLGRRAPVRRYQVHYLLTGWAADVAREHELLGAALRGLARHDAVAAEHLTGSLLAAGLPVLLAVARPGPAGARPELWSALGVVPRPAIDVLVTATVVPPLDTELTEPPARVDLAVAGRLPPVAAQRPRRVPQRRITEAS